MRPTGPPEPLSEADRRLWARVAASVRPLPGREYPLPPAPRPSLEDAPPPARRAPHAQPSRMRAPAPPPPVELAPLDGGWDRRLRSGRVEPDHVLDLHGLGVEQAHWLVEDRLHQLAARGARIVLVITGKGSRGADPSRRGVIRASLGHWLELPRLRPIIAALRPAHPRHGGAGAFYVVLRRAR